VCYSLISILDSGPPKPSVLTLTASGTATPGTAYDWPETLVLYRMRPALMQIASELRTRGMRYSRLQEAASGGDGCGIPYGISIDFRLESLARSGFCQKGSY